SLRPISANRDDVRERQAMSLRAPAARKAPSNPGPRKQETRLGLPSRVFSAGRTGLEPATSGVTGRRYNRLNYRPWALFRRGERRERDYGPRQPARQGIPFANVEDFFSWVQSRGKRRDAARWDEPPRERVFPRCLR